MTPRRCRRRRGPGLFGALVAATLAGFPYTAHSTEARSVVDTAIAAPDSETAALRDAMEDVAAHLAFQLRTERFDESPSDAPWPDDTVARVWIDARSSDRIEIRVTFVEPGGPPRSFVRSLTREGSTAVVVEDVAQIVRAALESMRETTPPTAPQSSPADAPAAPAASTPPLVAMPAAPPRAPKAPVGVDFVAFASEEAMSSRSGPTLGAGGAFDVSLSRVPWRPGLWLGAVYGSRFHVLSGPATFDIGSSSFRLMPGLALMQLETMQVDLHVGGGIDVFDVAPLIVRSSEAAFGTTAVLVDPVLSGQLLVRLRVVSQIRMTFGFDMDYDFNVQKVAAPSPRPGPHGSYEPWRLRPAMALGFCIPLTTGGACVNAR